MQAVIVSGSTEEIAALVLALQERRISRMEEDDTPMKVIKDIVNKSTYDPEPHPLKRSEDDLWPPVGRASADQRLFGGPGRGGNGEYSYIYGSLRIDDFKSAVEALFNIKASLERISSLLENGGVPLGIKEK